MTDVAREERAAALTRLMQEWWNPPTELISTIPRGGVELSYLGHADTTRALIETDPFWTWEPMAYDDHGAPVLERDANGNPIGLWGWLTICGVRRPAYGSCEPGKREAVKELIGDLIRNGALRAGCGGALWSKADRSISDEQVREIVAAAEAAGLTADEARKIVKTVTGANSSRDVTTDKFAALMDAITERAKATAVQAQEALQESFNAEAA